MTTAKTRATLKHLRTLSFRRRRCSHDAVVNIYGQQMIREWYYLQWAGWDFDLEPQELGDAPAWQAALRRIEEANADKPQADLFPYPEQPKWWPWWMEDRDDLKAMLDLGWSSGRLTTEGREWHEPWRRWALENGIAPGQPFCVEIGEPEVSKSGYYEVEYDVHWDAAVVEVIPLPPKVVSARWAHDERRTAAARALYQQLARDNATLLDRDVASMYIQQTLYSTDNGFPRGRRFTLRSARSLNPCVPCSIGTSGSDDEGDAVRAKNQLIQRACAINPYLSPDLLNNMRVIL